MSDVLVVQAEEEQKKQDRDKEWLIAWALLLFLLGANAGGVLSLAQRKRARTLLRSKFEQDTARIASSVAGGSLAVAVWMEQMAGSLDAYARSMAIAGAGTMPGATVVDVIEQRLGEQQPFLSRFAEKVSTGQMSPAAVAARSLLYGGVAWGGFFLAQGLAVPQNSFERWETMDDKHVCRVCAPRHGQIFAAGQGPMPGWDCLGVCRCQRVPVR